MRDPSLSGWPGTDRDTERRLFVEAALREMSEKELQLATDPESSVVLERLLYSMDDFARRVFMDSMSGSSVAGLAVEGLSTDHSPTQLRGSLQEPLRIACVPDALRGGC